MLCPLGCLVAIDNLAHHRSIRADESFAVKVLPAFRPDKAMAVADPEIFNQWVARLEAAANADISDYEAFLTTLQNRCDFFHQAGCRLSDHGLEQPLAEDFTFSEVKEIFNKVRSGRRPPTREIMQFKSAVLLELARMYADRHWTQQFHIGA